MENTETELNKQLANYTNNILSVTSSISSLHLQKTKCYPRPIIHSMFGFPNAVGSIQGFSLQSKRTRVHWKQTETA